MEVESPSEKVQRPSFQKLRRHFFMGTGIGRGKDRVRPQTSHLQLFHLCLVSIATLLPIRVKAFSEEFLWLSCGNSTNNLIDSIEKR